MHRSAHSISIPLALAWGIGLVLMGYVLAQYVVPAPLSTAVCVAFPCILKSVHGSSMAPTISDGDSVRVAVDYYGRYPVERNDIVLIDFNVDGFLRLKRVVGLPGDEIELDDMGNVRVNGAVVLVSPIDRPFTEQEFIFFNSAVVTPTGKFIPSNRTLVLGDNPLGGADSRSWGFVSPDLFMGKVVEIISRTGTGANTSN